MRTTGGQELLAVSRSRFSERRREHVPQLDLARERILELHTRDERNRIDDAGNRTSPYASNINRRDPSGVFSSPFFIQWWKHGRDLRQTYQ